MMRDDEVVVRKEAAWALANATAGGSFGQISYLVDQGCIPAFVGAIGVDTTMDKGGFFWWVVIVMWAAGECHSFGSMALPSVFPPKPHAVPCPPVALEGLQNILRVGQAEADKAGTENKV